MDSTGTIILWRIRRRKIGKLTQNWCKKTNAKVTKTKVKTTKKGSNGALSENLEIKKIKDGWRRGRKRKRGGIEAIKRRRILSETGIRGREKEKSWIW